jgi:NTE family protein
MELEDHGLKPDIITGTSIGGLVGALIASGLDSNRLIEVFRRMSFGTLYSMPWRKPALMDNRKLEKLLEETIGRPTFADLEIPLAVVTADLVSREEVVLEEGDVISAVLATTAFPVILPPVRREGKTLIDGGVMNNTPFDLARERGADYVLAIDLSKSAPFGAPVPYPPGSNFLVRILTRAQRDPLYQAVTTMTDIITSQNVDAHLEKSPPDLLLEPEIGTIGLFDFHRLNEGIASGRKAAQAAGRELSMLAKRFGGDAS